MSLKVHYHTTGYQRCESAWLKEHKLFAAKTARPGDAPYEIIFFTKGPRDIKLSWQNYNAKEYSGLDMPMTRVDFSIMGAGSLQFEHPTVVPRPGYCIFKGKFPRLASEHVAIWYRPESHHVCNDKCEELGVLL